VLINDQDDDGIDDGDDSIAVSAESSTMMMLAHTSPAALRCAAQQCAWWAALCGMAPASSASASASSTVSSNLSTSLSSTAAVASEDNAGRDDEAQSFSTALWFDVRPSLLLLLAKCYSVSNRCVCKVYLAL
jgi:hypothetical protein